MKILIKKGHVIDPSQGLDGVFDLLVEGRKIKEVSKSIPESGVKVIDAKGMHVLPGLVDMHVHLREPGFEHKETIRTGTHAAVKGGFCSVCAMPNTVPVNDNPGITDYILQKAHDEGMCTVFPIGAITKGQRGEELAEMGMMKEAGCVAFSDDGRSVENSLLMRRALEYSKVFGVPVISHCEDRGLSEGGVMNEGLLSQSLGLRGIPKAAEETIVYRDIALAELTGGRLHIAHVSTAGSVQIIREAKKRGVRVTAETCPHYFTVSEEAVRGYNTDAKVNPPLRTADDMEALKGALKDGTIDVIATDHAPHHPSEKIQEFDFAPSGISGLETALPLALRLMDEGVLDMSGIVRKMALTPSEILGINKGTLKPGADADIAIIDLKKKFKVDKELFVSKGKNSPFHGWDLTGMPVVTISMGKVYEWQ
jgi:dihydroorotase